MANLAPVVDTLEQVPEAARQFYVQKDGKFHVDIAGGVVPAADLTAANAKVVEFRDKNIALLQEVEPLRVIKTQFEGIDPVAAKEAIAKTKELKSKGVSGADDVAVMIQNAVDAALKPVNEKLTAAETTAQANARLAADQTLRAIVGEKFVKAGGKPKAIDFILEQAKTTFKVENGVVVALPNKYSAEKPGEAISVDEWLIGASKEHDFVFESSTGSGAAPARTTQARPAGQEVLRDPTAQELGSRSADILAGKVRVEYSK